MKIKKVLCSTQDLTHHYPAWIVCISDNYGVVGVDHFWIRTNGSYAVPPTAKSIRCAVRGYSLSPLPESVLPYAERIEQIAPSMKENEIIDLNAI